MTVRPARRCAVCHGDFAVEAPASCLACQVHAHVGCFMRLARCPTLGCGPAIRRGPATAAFLARPEREPSVLRTCLGSLIALWVLLFMAAVVTQPTLEQGHKARVQRVCADMKAIRDAIELFRVDVGRDPVRLSELWERPADGRRWGPEPYLREYPPKDPWGNEYLYELQLERLQLVSFGVDGSAGGVEEARDLVSRAPTVFGPPWGHSQLRWSDPAPD